MINLLIISNNPRSKELQAHFQQILKLKIDLSTDFDQGLKEVFEKRPRIVCIQDQIAGVTGESVARHIQLLLGKSSPIFILQHAGNPNARTITGLFNYMVDMEQPLDQRICRIKNIIKEVAGDEQWEKIYKPSAEPENSSSQQPFELHEYKPPDANEEQELQTESSFNEQLSVLTATIEAFKTDEPDSDKYDYDSPLYGQSSEAVAQQIQETEPSAFGFHEPEQTPSTQAIQNVRTDTVLPQESRLDQPSQPPKPASASPFGLEAGRKTVKITSKMMDDKPFDGNGINSIDSLQQSTEQKQLKRKQLIRIAALLIVLVLIIVRGVQWYINRPDLNQQADEPAAVKQDKQKPGQNAETTEVQPDHNISPKQNKPAFIAIAKKDSEWQGSEPGWSRYLTDNREYRLFHADQELHAVQVIALGGTTIQTEEFQNILQELSGQDDYRITSGEQKDGAWQERARVLDLADLLIYRSKAKGPILAFVYAVSK